MTELVGMHFLVSGKVQGVWFRAGTKEKAEQLGLTGYVRNLPDGRVEVLAFGARAELQLMSEWLQQGPKLANVSEVIQADIPWQAYQQFEVT